MTNRLEAFTRPTLRLLPGEIEVAANNIFVIGRNYAEDPAQRAQAANGTPSVALKPTSALLAEGAPILLPAGLGPVVFEIEMLMLVGRSGRNIPESAALEHIAGYGVGLDLIATEQHLRAKREGQPWAVCKGFDHAAPVSAFISADEVPQPEMASFWLDINGARRQTGQVNEAIFGPRRIISYLSSIFTLNPGDIIYTGTPAGAGLLQSGDCAVLNYNEQISATFDVV